MKRGYAKLWRKILSHPFWLEKRVFSRAEAWIDLILMASGTDKVVKNIEGQEVLLKRGEVLVSERELSHRWQWSQTKVSRFMRYLMTQQMTHRKPGEKTHRKTLKMGQEKTLVTILNYERYNPVKEKDETSKKWKDDSPVKQENDSHIKEGKNKELPKDFKERERQGRDRDHERFLERILLGRGKR